MVIRAEFGLHKCTETLSSPEVRIEHSGYGILTAEHVYLRFMAIPQLFVACVYTEKVRCGYKRINYY